LNVYDTIYFTQSHEIGEFVKQKGIFKIVDSNGFTKELDHLEEERIRNLQNMIAELEKEKESLNDEKTKLLEDLNRQISLNEKRHQDNEAKIKNLKTVLRLLRKNIISIQKK
jgi:predicted  nucleic acid-binding Zn-ribbon protein